MHIRGIPGLVILLLAAGCVANPDDNSAGTSKDDGQTPAVVDGKAVSQDAIRNSLNRGQRVIVLFAEDDDTGVSCPAKVRTLDNLCDADQFQNQDPSVICRLAADATVETRDKVITWVSEEPFTIEFNTSMNPCSNPGWDGAQLKTRHHCILKNSAAFQIEPGRSAYIKYAVGGQGCAPLDPFFIVRR